MGSMFILMSLAIAILSLHKESAAFSAYNVSAQRQPQKAFEIIEVTLPKNTENPGRSIENIKEFHTHEEPRYEIFIKPTKNRQNTAGGRKIKIFVESEDYSNENQSTKNSSILELNEQNHQPIPLTIVTKGLNVDTFQYGKHGRENSNRTVKPIMYESNQMYNLHNGSFNIQESDSKSVHTLKDIPEQVTKLYGDGYISQQKEDREKRNKYKSNSEKESVISTKPVEEHRSSYVSETNYKDSSPQIYRPVQREQIGNNPYVDMTERHYPETHFDKTPSHDREVGVEKVLVFEPNTGISVSKVSPADPGRNHIQTIRSTHDFDYDGTKAQSGRRPTNTYEGTDHAFLTRKPGRNVEEQTSYHEIQPAHEIKHPSSDYSRGATTHNLSNGRRIPDERYSSDRKTVYTSEERHPYAEETEDASTSLPYEIASINTQSNLGGRPVREDSYKGFPETYSTNGYESSRPSSFGGSYSTEISPCPNVLKYTSFESDRWYAQILVRTDETLVGMRLDIILDRPADLMTATTPLKSQDNIRFTVLSLKKTLVPGKTERVDIMVKFINDGSSRMPYVKTIDLNGRMICPSRMNSYPQATTTRRPVFPIEVQEQRRTTERNPNPYNGPAVINEYPSGTRRTTPKPITSTKRTTPPTDYIPAPNPDYYEQPNHNRLTTSKPTQNRPLVVNNNPTVPSGNNNRRPSTESHGINPVSNSANNNNNLRPNDREKRNILCGKPAVQPRPLITSGQITTRGQWPWHVALYKNTVPDLKYICGGSLVTENHIITAAHCATKEHTSTALNPNMLLVYLGKYNLQTWTEQGALSRDVSRVTIHPDFNVTNFRSDIAVLTLAQKVEYNDFIRPVCLWDKRSTLIDDIVGLEGTVVGWGYDETKQLTEELKQAKMPVVAQNVCLWSYPEFFPKFTHNNTYCAGFKNGTSVCNGDSGGGMFFPIKINREERWFLRGLVSLSASEKTTKICDINHYVVFADTAKYLPWLEDVLSRV